MTGYMTAVFMIALLAVPTTSHAYLDPGTGSMILQGVIAAIALGAFTLKQYWHRFLALFQRGSQEKDSEEAPDPEETPDP